MKKINLKTYKKNKISFRSQNLSVKHSLSEKVRTIIEDVKKRGDRAVTKYTKVFDGLDLKDFQVKQEEWKSADELSQESKNAIKKAYENIKNFHNIQFPKNLSLNQNGIQLKKEFRAIDPIGLYIPGGTSPLFSTLLMLAIPAQIARCKRIAMMTPPSQDGGINPAVLYSAKVCGLTELYKVGGAQGIAAMAYGTESIPKVSKIFGPGNKYVTEAKLQVSKDPYGAAFDMPAGPSEVLVIADAKANPRFVASDLLAQGEHDTEARVTLVTPDEKLSQNVLKEIDRQKVLLQRIKIIEKSLSEGLIIIAPDIQSCFDISNDYAPEHLILHLEDSSQYLPQIQNAGSVFIGPWSAEALGDYASGPNHVLPTYGYAKSYSGLSVDSFMKAITFQKVSQRGFMKIAPCVEELSSLEGLGAHKNSISLRKKFIQFKKRKV